MPSQALATKCKDSHRLLCVWLQAERPDTMLGVVSGALHVADYSLKKSVSDFLHPLERYNGIDLTNTVRDLNVMIIFPHFLNGKIASQMRVDVNVREYGSLGTFGFICMYFLNGPLEPVCLQGNEGTGNLPVMPSTYFQNMH